MNKTKLFCFPYAGGSTTVYMKWLKKLNRDISLIPIELPGRGKRFKEQYCNSFDEAVEDTCKQVCSQLGDKDRFILYGHSMGSLLAYEVTHKLKENLYNEPMHIFFSGRYPPHIIKNERLHLMTDDELIEEILKFGGTPRELFEDEQLLSLFLPIIRADYQIINTYEYRERSTKLDCNISCLNGLDDEDILDFELKQWSNCTNGNCSFYEFDGGHFFINDKSEEIINIINETVERDGESFTG
jgi:medium-chain acyl-[acyl-carrier-protein] hydrolase